MHKLDRGQVRTPACLDRFSPGRQHWGHLTSEDREEVRGALNVIQGKRCAYCECGIVGEAGHIEHFFPRSRFPGMAFDWSNLFYSCDSRRTCGNAKDGKESGEYNPEDLIKPDVDEPDEFLLFLPNGQVVPRSSLDPGRRRRASETIRVFKLGDQKLEGKRRRALKQFTDANPDLEVDLGVLSEQERSDWIAIEIEAISDNPHASVIRHLLMQWQVHKN